MGQTLSQAAAKRLSEHLRNYSIELTPGAAKNITNLQSDISQHTPVYVTFLPGSDFADTIALCKRLKDEAYSVIPHIAVRSFRSQEHLRESLLALNELGIHSILLIGGALDRPLGPYPSVLKVLESGVLDGIQLSSIGFAGHPEGNPDIDPKVLQDVLKEKNTFAQQSSAECYLITQFCFDPNAVVQWAQQLRAQGIDFPLHIGVPGVGSVRSLLRHARHCGIGPSIGYLLKNGNNLKQLLSIATPERLLVDLVNAEERGEIAIARFHFYPLGGWEQTHEWLRRVRTDEWPVAKL